MIICAINSNFCRLFQLGLYFMQPGSIKSFVRCEYHHHHHHHHHTNHDMLTTSNVSLAVGKTKYTMKRIV